jgi:secreted trypsin-like serine protease
MRKTKLLLAAAMVALMLSAGAGSAAFAAPHIVGGSPVPSSDKYPWIAALLDVNRRVPGGTDQDMQICGASLIDSDSVLTAAHCINVAPRYLRVVLGRAQLSASGGEVRQVLNSYEHPNYTGGSDNDKYDVAVLTLDKPVTGITPVKLPLSTDNWSEQPGKSQTIAGWGAMMAGGTARPDRMQEVKVPVVSDADAAKPGSGFVPDLMISAGEKGKDTCQGDSGGPLFASYKSLGKRPPGTTPPPNPPYQYGITAFGNGCGVEPGTYTEVNAPSIREFITTSMNK